MHIIYMYPYIHKHTYIIYIKYNIACEPLKHQRVMQMVL